MKIIKEYRFYVVIIIIGIFISTQNIQFVLIPHFLLTLTYSYSFLEINKKWLIENKKKNLTFLMICLYIINIVSYLILLSPLFKEIFKIETNLIILAFFTYFVLNLLVFPYINFISFKNRFKNKYLLILLIFLFNLYNPFTFLFLLPLNSNTND